MTTICDGTKSLLLKAGKWFSVIWLHFLRRGGREGGEDAVLILVMA